MEGYIVELLNGSKISPEESGFKETMCTVLLESQDVFPTQHGLWQLLDN